MGSYLVFGLSGDNLLDAAELAESVTLFNGIGNDPAIVVDDYQIKTGRIGVDLSGINSVGGLQFQGEAILPVGDFNGDGLADLIVGASLIYGRLGDELMLLADSSTGEATLTLNDLAALGTGFDGIVFDGADTVLSVGDLNGDDLSDIVVSDLSAGTAGESYLIYGVGNVPGDLNGDGIVDLIDYDIIASNYGTAVTEGVWALGDLVPDGAVNANDFNQFAAYYSIYGAGGSGPIPEPATVTLSTVMMAAGLLAVRRRHSKRG